MTLYLIQYCLTLRLAYGDEVDGDSMWQPVFAETMEEARTKFQNHFEVNNEGREDTVYYRILHTSEAII